MKTTFKKILISALVVLVAQSAWSQAQKSEKIYGAIPYYSEESKGIEVVVPNGGCTTKEDFSWEVQKPKDEASPLLQVTLLRKDTPRCEGFVVPLTIRYSYEEMGLKPHSMFKIKNEMIEFFYSE